MKRLIILLGLLLSLQIILRAEVMEIANYDNGIQLLQSSSSEMILEMKLGAFEREALSINDDTWYNLSVKNGGLTLEQGLPQVPILAGSVIISANARMVMETMETEYLDLKMKIAPSKGNLTRDINPESIPYTFSEFYKSSDYYPENHTELSEPFILRDYRGISVRFKPFVYYPETGITRVYTRIKVKLSQDGSDLTNALSFSKHSYAAEYSEIYRNMFLNFAEAKYPSIDEEGRILVITNSMFDNAILPWVNWKKQMGFDVSVVDYQVAGPSASQIKTYIQNQYILNDGLMFVQIMGDAPQVPSLSYNGGGSDPSFALLAGNDNYPEIFVGRFSAQTVAEMETQVQRSIEYERDLQNDATWLQNAMGIASEEGGGYQGDNGESDQQHMENIRTDLLGYGYTSVDQMYANMGATAYAVGNNINTGRGFINYVGHGSDTSWVTTGFNNNNVNALTNDNMLPFIASVACVNGNFVSRTCFAEAWMRATNNGNPTGAVAIYASSVNQGWNPPMRAQDEITDLLIAEAKHSIGGLFYNGSSKMIEVYGSDGADEFKNWHIFGDASLMVRTKTPTEALAEYNPVLLIGMQSLDVTTEPYARLSLSAEGTIYGIATADANGTALLNLDILPEQPMNLTLTITAFNKVTHIGTVEVLPADGPYIIVTGVSVEDDNDNNPSLGEIVTIQVNMENVGSDPAEGVSVSAITSDPHLTVVGDAEIIDYINPNTIGSTSTGIQLQISDSVPDQYSAAFTVLVTLQDGSEYNYDHEIVINAPRIVWGSLQINDSQGNNNGRVDPGESFTISIPISNLGHADCPELFSSITIEGGETIISPIVDTIPLISAGNSSELIYNIALSSQIEPGSTISINIIASYAQTVLTNTYAVITGILMENFENGMSNFPWTFTGGNWISTENGYQGSLAAQSAPINHNQTTSMSITLTNPSDGFVSFWKKTSSEANHDYLKFFVNGMLKNQWSGIDEDWEQVSYIVLAGTNTYRWEYVKDSSVSAGNDCVLIDDVLFPAEDSDTGHPIMVIDHTSLDFGNIEIGTEEVQNLTISNTGDALMLGSVVLQEPYSLLSQNSYLNNMNFTVPAGESLILSIAFRPIEKGDYDAELQIDSDDPDNPSVIVTLSGSSSTSDPNDMVNPVITELRGNYPNPFNPNTSISFSLKDREYVSIEIYNVLGQRVKTLVASVMNPGSHTVAWNGKDNNNRNVSSGVYFYKMKAGKYSHTKKMILMK
ncbi:MAG: C25 family cysteine peptidase [Candidatus Cloacimonetes bacterium]|nr:C25 family cysteine peptidase [Candidatus Cloacimonadota bacterium]MDD2506441.1 C25 family cysteine peptidase [Candidatus Cloacimonadota bacterium]MDD4560624.1 C25 family cysteine peptidase [Candidatus Cloacimonadota bacterium]